MAHKSRPISTVQTEEYLCGIGSWHPKWLQSYATTKMFLFIFGMIGILQGASYTYLIASITTLEKRYAFGSKVTGLILIADNFPALIFNPLFGYLANRVHRPRMIGYSMLVVGLGFYLSALPYFIYGPGVHLLNSDDQALITSTNNRSIEFCDSNRRPDINCGDNTGSNTVIPAVVILWIASFCNGIGFVAFYTIGIPFIDDSVKKKNSPLYISTTGALRLCGPTLGFILSSFVLRYYENPLIDPGIGDRNDPRWIGAWWIGFLVLGTGILIFTLPMFLFPRQFKSAVIDSQNTTKKLLKTNDKNEVERKLWYRIKRLMKNPVYICYVIGTNVRLFSVLGYMTFQSKYIESEYKKSASSANLFSGLIGIVPSATGIFLGGLFIRQFQPGPRALTTFITLVEIFGVMGLLSALFLGCPVSEFAGKRLDSNFEMQSLCNDKCFCSETVFQPICGSDNKTNYFSACFAGCEAQSLIQNTDKPNQYSKCDCFEGLATEGYCNNNCNNFQIYVTLLGISNIIGNLAKTGNSIISFRIVDERDKSFAIGVMGLFMCLFAFIPYPLVYGAVADAACLVWERTCGQRGNCWVYDSTKFRQYLHGLTLGLYFLGSVFDIIVIFLAKRIKNLYKDDIEVEEQSPINMRLSSSVDKYLSRDTDLEL